MGIKSTYTVLSEKVKTVNGSMGHILTSLIIFYFVALTLNHLKSQYIMVKSSCCLVNSQRFLPNFLVESILVIKKHTLVGGLEHGFYFSIFWGHVIIPTDFHSMIFQRVGLNHQPVQYRLLPKSSEIQKNWCPRPPYLHCLTRTTEAEGPWIESRNAVGWRWTDRCLTHHTMGIEPRRFDQPNRARTWSQLRNTGWWLIYG